MFINFDKALGIHQHALHVYGQRSKVLASNIVNADTPNYKAREIDFRSTLAGLRDAEDKDMLEVTMDTSEHSHISEVTTGMPTADELLYRVPLQPSLDGNTVDSQTEVAAFTENSIRYQASLRFLTGRIQTMISAFKGE